jgi:potassium/hydrogen antiporter
VFLTIVLVQFLLIGEQTWQEVTIELVRQTIIGTLIGILGGRAIVLVLNQLGLPQGLHAPFVTTSALVIFGFAAALHGSGFLAVYLAGLVVGNRATRAHNTVIAFLDALTWLAQIAMFVLLGLLVTPERLIDTLVAALAVAVTLMFFARPVAVFLCLMPFRFPWREKSFIAWIGLRGAVGIFLASIPMLVKLPNAEIYFNIAFVVVLASLLIQGWSIAPAARLLTIAFPRQDHMPRRVELDLPGQLEQELVGYPVAPNSPYLRRGLLPSWARPTLVVRDQKILSPLEAEPVRPGDYVYLLAPPEKAQALDRFFVDMPPPARPDLRLLGDFFVTGEHTLGELADIYGLTVAEEEKGITLADHFAKHGRRVPRPGDALPLGEIALVAHQVVDGRVVSVGLRLAEVEPDEAKPSRLRRLKQIWRKLWARLG